MEPSQPALSISPRKTQDREENRTLNQQLKQTDPRGVPHELVSNTEEREQSSLVGSLDGNIGQLHCRRWGSLARVRSAPEQVAEYAFATALHYGGKVNVWEIWNEPNLDSFWPNPNAGAYVAVLKQGYLAVKYANPTAFVLLGGLGSNGDDKSRIADFLRGVYSQGGRGYFDGVPIHPYIDWSGDRPVEICTKMIQDTRIAMASSGDGNKPLIINEVGWEFGREQSKSQVDAIHQMVSVAFENGVSAFYYFNLRDGLPEGSDFGLLDANSQPRPSYYAYRQLAGCP
jgi:hypothetical protein